jgi:hypothetical protein
MKAFLIVILLLASFNVSASVSEEGISPIAFLVGGACSYQKFAGTCTIDDTGAEFSIFTFSGRVNGANVVLSGNKGQGVASAKNGDTFKCRLGFITRGTCTPCVFLSDLMSFGECGEEAWELFRKNN